MSPTQPTPDTSTSDQPPSIHVVTPTQAQFTDGRLLSDLLAPTLLYTLTYTLALHAALAPRAAMCSLAPRAAMCSLAPRQAIPTRPQEDAAEPQHRQRR